MSDGANHWHAIAMNLRNELTRLTAELTRLRTDLRRFGGHKESCRYWLTHRSECSCGWSEVVKAIGGSDG